jgi:sulfur-carrier protein
MPTVKVPPVLRQQTDGEAEVSVDGATVGEVLRNLAKRYPPTKDQLFSPEGDLNRYVNVYLNDEDVRVLDGLDTAAGDSDTVVILPAMAGGRQSAAARAGRGRGAAGQPHERVRGGLRVEELVNRPVWSNQMPPGMSRPEYQITPAILYRPRLAAISEYALHR